MIRKMTRYAEITCKGCKVWQDADPALFAGLYRVFDGTTILRIHRMVIFTEAVRQLCIHLLTFSSRENQPSRMGPKAHPQSKGLAAINLGGTALRVYFQKADDGSIQELAYVNNSKTKGWVSYANFQNALIGTSITSFVDDANGIHVYYQGNTAPYPIIEQYYNGSVWGQSLNLPSCNL